MKLRYQMRGLGIGIIVTALLMGVALDDGVPLSDAEIRALASELGMVESDSLKLTDIQNQTSGSNGSTEGNNTEQSAGNQGNSVPTEAPGSENGNSAGGESQQSPEDGSQASGGTATAEPVETEAPTVTEEPKVTTAPDVTAQPQTTEAPDQSTEEGEYVEIVIYPGENSYGVSMRLAELGLVVDALEFDTYLCDYGYSRSINVGTYRIKVGTSEEEIAKIITKSK